jgi:hypothetical protein
MSIITGYERPDAGARGSVGVANVAELYDALVNGRESLTNVGAADAEITSSMIDGIFISHGFFADLDGDRKYNPEVDGEVGSSSHPVIQVGGTSYPELIPRRNPDAYDSSLVTINTGDATVDAIIQISIPGDGGSGSYAYVMSLNGSNRIELAVPAPDEDAEVTIITAARGYKPVIAFRINADDFHEKVENGTISELQVTPVELEPGSTIAPPAANGPAIQLGIIIGGIIAVLLVVASLVAIHRRWGTA